MSWWHRANAAVEDFFCEAEPLTMLLTISVGVAALLVLMGGCVALIDTVMPPPPNHGSCKVGHYVSTGKTTSLICDEWYPLPQVQGQNQ